MDDKKGNKPHLIVGCGKTGLSVVKYLQAKNESCVIGDEYPDKVRSLLKSVGISDERIYIYSFDEIVSLYPDSSFFLQAIVSPGIPPNHNFLKWCQKSNLLLTSELEIALREIHAYTKSSAIANKPLIFGITGTNGKTTTVELITHILNVVGCKAESYGNIGRPLIDLITPSLEGKDLADVYVLELSSYQIQRISQPVFNGCIWLNITPDHLDWHGNFDEYCNAKKKLIRLIDVVNTKKLRFGAPVAVLNHSVPSLEVPKNVFEMRYGLHKRENSSSWIEGDFFFSEKAFSSTLLPKQLQSINHPAYHDIENFLAAATLIHSTLGYSLEEIAHAYSTFKKGAHRLQFICSHGNVDFYDDSKGTNIHATLAAVESLPYPIVLIAGGVHKGYPYHAWRDLFTQKVICVVAIGQAKHAIAKDLGDTTELSLSESLFDAVSYAFDRAKRYSDEKGEKVSVLLSPGCSSFDMFKDYKERGEQFQKIVQAFSGV